MKMRIQELCKNERGFSSLANIGIVATTLLLSGCVSCNQASFYKSISNQDNHDIRTDFYNPNIAEFDVGKKAIFSVKVCGDKYLPTPQEANGLCANVLLDESAVMQLQDTKVVLTNLAGKNFSMVIESIGYHISCQMEPSGERSCTSSESSPVAGTMPILSKTNVPNLNAYRFSSNLPFKGAVDTMEQGAWFGHRLSGWRRYYFQIADILLNGMSEISVQLPKVFIDGQLYALPVLKYRAVTEDVCHYVSPR